MMILIRVCILLLTGSSAMALTNGFLKPLIGYNPYYTFFSATTADMMTNVSRAIHTNGIQAAVESVGAKFNMNIGAHWSDGTVDSNGVPIADADKFPNGVKPVADFVHSMGLNFGMVGQGGVAGSDPAFNEGVSGHWTNCIVNYATNYLADLFICDFLDGVTVGTNTYTAQQQAGMLCGAFVAASRPMRFMIVNVPIPSWAPGLCNSDRTSFDADGTYADMLQRADDFNASASLYGGTNGFWGDADDLVIEILNQVLTPTECRTHFSLWCVMGTTLMWSSAMTNCSGDTLSYATNREFYAIHQDDLVTPGTRRSRVSGIGGNMDVWARPITNGLAVCFVNNCTVTTNINFNFSGLGLSNDVALVRDVGNRANIGVAVGNYTAMALPSHGSLTVTLTGVSGSTRYVGTLNAGTVNIK